MGTRNRLWHFILSVFLCTVMALEGRDATTATAGSRTNVSGSTSNNTSNASVAEPNTLTNNSLLGTTLLSPSTTRMVPTPRTTTREGRTLGMSAESSAASPTAGTSTTAPSTGTENGTAPSSPLSSATMSHSSSSSSSSSPKGSPSPQQSSTSSTTGTPLASTSHPPMALVFSSLPSPAGITRAQPSAGTAGAMTQGPATPRPVAATPGTSPASGTIEARLSSTLGSSTETSAPQLASTPLTQGQPTPEVTAAPSPTGTPSPSVTTASAGSSAIIPPGEGDSSTMNQGNATTTSGPSTEGSHSLTSLVSTVRMVSGEGRTDTTPTAPAWEGSSPGTSPRSGALSPAFPTKGPGTSTAPSTGTESGTAPSLSLSSAVTSHSSSSSPEGSPAVTPSPQQSNTSTTEMFLASTSHLPTALVSSPAGVTGMESGTVTAEEVTASTNPVPSASITSPASDTTASSHSSTPGSSMETPGPRHTSTPLTQGQPTLEVTVTSSPTGSPLPSVTTASAGSSATIPPGEGDSSTTTQGIRTAEPTASTSHSLPSTSLATPSTTNLSTSTSANPSFTGTCSPISLSIQLQNVTSTVIQFSWKPQGGTGDSPYTVRLLGEPGGTQERILNETSTSFENLLSGHQYQISVDVSTCSKNVSTSLTVQTAAEVYRGSTRITNEVFKTEYQNKSSTEFKEFEEQFIMEITNHLPQKIQELKNETKIRIVINSIENGSVIVDFDIVLDIGQNITKSEVSDAFIDALNGSTIFKADLQKTFVEARNSCEPGLNDCNQNASCTAEGATYSCECNKGFTDQSPLVPGRDCQQDLPSQHTTTAPPNTNTTSTTGTGSTTPVPPDNTTTNTTGTGQTTTAPPNTNTNTTGTGSTTPAPPETNTTGFTRSTPSSVYTTTFTSAPCMPVSIKVQDVTAEEIQLSWTSSSKDSFYNISVMDGKKINTKHTNETKAVFKNLRPGNVYTISVAESSCAENKHTSVTVQTDSASCWERTDFCSAQNTGCSDLKGVVCSNQAFSCSVRFKSLTFNNTLYNSDSEEYKTMSESIKTDVVEGMQAKLGNDRFNVLLLGFRNGSVIADFLFLLPQEEAMDVNDVQTYLREVFWSKFGNEAEVKAQSVQSSTDNSSSWRVAVIVLGVLLGVALLLILLGILFYIYMRRRSELTDTMIQKNLSYLSIPSCML
ncbi:mucin-5AC-like isoform X2 [Prinia subflava]|uniref:mucin-5AC-like isoform X2 n=1 Tax=Prinia subflava TaxID=208062 RepID=UPI002FE25EF7